MNVLSQSELGLAKGQPKVLDDEVNLSALFRTLWRGKFWVLLSATIAALIGIYYAFFLAVPVYMSAALVALDSRQEQVVDIESVVSGLSGDQATINTEVEVIRSRGLATKLVNRLDLLSDPDFNTSLLPEPDFSVGKVVLWVREQIEGQKPEPVVLTDQMIMDRTVDEVLKSISVSNVRQSYVFQITAVSTDPAKAALISNTLSELYIREQIDVKFKATEQASEWLANRVAQLQKELEQAEGELKAFSSNTNLISPDALIAMNLQLKDLRERRESAAELLDASREADPLSARTARLQAQFDVLDSSAIALANRIDLQSGELVRMQQFERETEASRLIYEYFLGRLKETSAQQGIQQADSRIISAAVVPGDPSTPRKGMIVVMSVVLGVMVGFGGVLGREMSQNTFRVADELEAKTGFSVMGQIPLIPAKRRQKVLDYLAKRPNSAAAEAIRNLRTSVLLTNLDNELQIIMSTSSIPGEGKTTTSLALAQNLSGLGKKVLLLEADIRRRTFAEYFNVKDRNGLLSVLSGDVSIEDAVVYDEIMKCDVLIGEESKVNAADVFSSKKFEKFLTTLRKKYDYIVIDTPPVLAVPDARIIGQMVDATLYSVRWNHTTHRQVNDGLKSFQNVGVLVSGLVLGQISEKGMKRYGYGDSYGAYNAYYDT